MLIWLSAYHTLYGRTYMIITKIESLILGVANNPPTAVMTLKTEARMDTKVYANNMISI